MQADLAWAHVPSVAKRFPALKHAAVLSEGPCQVLAPCLSERQAAAPSAAHTSVAHLPASAIIEKLQRYPNAYMLMHAHAHANHWMIADWHTASATEGAICNTVLISESVHPHEALACTSRFQSLRHDAVTAQP